ncbi:hypothetical protein, partial [Enterococcus ureilyticus]|uniref:hypothetical protein n=1 Tax=Enterococcus ureilyticus TaxID=1131292 RepID=UPI0012FD7F88
LDVFGGLLWLDDAWRFFFIGYFALFVRQVLLIICSAVWIELYSVLDVFGGLLWLDDAWRFFFIGYFALFVRQVLLIICSAQQSQ